MLDIAVPGQCCGLASPGNPVGRRIHIRFEVENQAACVSMAAVFLQVVGAQDQNCNPLRLPTGHLNNPQA